LIKLLMVSGGSCSTTLKMKHLKMNLKTQFSEIKRYSCLNQSQSWCC